VGGGEGMAVKALFALLDERRQAIIRLICEHIRESKKCRDLTNPRKIGETTFLYLTGICKRTGMSHITVSKIVQEFQEAGLVEIYEIGRAKILMPTSVMLEICEALKE